MYKAGLFSLGVAILVLGIIILNCGGSVLTQIVAIGGTVLILHGSYNLIAFITSGGKLSERRKKRRLIMAAINIGAGVVVLIMPKGTASLIIFVFALYVLLNGLSKLADFVIAKINKQSGHWSELIAAIFFFVFTINLLMPSVKQESFVMILGVYGILFGAELISDFIRQIIPQKAKNSLKRRIRISPPVFIATFIPINTLRKINEYISVNDAPPELEGPERDDKAPPDIEVMVHISNNGSGKIGHLDLYLDGEVISYGNHDHSSHKLFSVFGDGVLFTADKETYLDFSVTHDRKMIFSYGFRLTPDQLAAVRKEAESLKASTVPWKPPLQVAVENAEKGEEIKPSAFHDYCSQLWNGTHANFFKFKKGKFKTYSILSTNCVLLTDTILGKAGADIVFINGIASPGSYFDYLERLYMTENSMVISKTIYDRKSMRKLKKEKSEQEKIENERNNENG